MNFTSDIEQLLREEDEQQQENIVIPSSPPPQPIAHVPEQPAAVCSSQPSVEFTQPVHIAINDEGGMGIEEDDDDDDDVKRQQYHRRKVSKRRRDRRSNMKKMVNEEENEYQENEMGMEGEVGQLMPGGVLHEPINDVLLSKKATSWYCISRSDIKNASIVAILFVILTLPMYQDMFNDYLPYLFSNLRLNTLGSLVFASICASLFVIIKRFI
uniref:Uncharacterized protein n=1 Tax=viral metagenome TaxID=1070528 RepID=A0A6C0CQJ3_9ZZZZ